MGAIAETDGKGEPLFINVIVFADTVQVALLAMGDSDSVVLSGTLKLGEWIDRDDNARPSLDMVAHVMLTTYHVIRKRKAAQGGGEDQPQRNDTQPLEGQRGDATDSGGFDDPR